VALGYPYERINGFPFVTLFPPKGSPPLPDLVECLWEGGGYGARRDRQPFRFQAFMPDPIAEWDRPLAGRAAEAVARATATLSELQAGGSRHDLEALATTLLRAEALGSSFIEGLRASNKQLALAAYEPVAADPTARAVLGTVRAMERAIALGTEPRRFRLEDLLDIHRTLLEGTTEEHFAGVVRTEQNWIGGRGSTLATASFVPPPPNELDAALGALEAFIDDGKRDVPLLVRCGLVHAQFETIHPFLDGNGPIGRLLITLMLCEEEALVRPLLYLSMYLKAHRAEYYDRLTAIRTQGIGNNGSSSSSAS